MKNLFCINELKLCWWVHLNSVEMTIKTYFSSEIAYIKVSPSVK